MVRMKYFYLFYVMVVGSTSFLPLIYTISTPNLPILATTTTTTTSLRSKDRQVPQDSLVMHSSLYLPRSLDFWLRVAQIYSSYKLLQAQEALQSSSDSFGFISRINFEQKWNELHEKNAQRMMNLCLSLRGFYLKSGQFLGESLTSIKVKDTLIFNCNFINRNKT